MSPRFRFLPVARRLTLGTAFLVLSACATVPAGKPLKAGQQASLQGNVVSVDTAPWAYDGNAIIVISTSDAGNVDVQLPARWNLCKAQPLGDVQALKPGDRVEVVGTVSESNRLVVCSEPQHLLRKVD
jgi:hypothetical protein